MTNVVETIIAVSTGPGISAIGIMRASGPGTPDLYQALTGRAHGTPRRTVRIEVRGQDGRLLDDGLGLWFSGPGSYTGEDLFELHLHGSPAVAAAVIRAALATGLCRMADPGEFTRRAVLAGKFDLTQAEAIGDLVNAETEAQRALAVRHKDGAVGKLIQDWQDRLTGALAHLEAVIDFPDEDLPAALDSSIRTELETLAEDMARHRDGRARLEKLRSGFSIAMVGAPNAGKSTLLNQLASRDAAIVSARAGTTRDVVEVQLEIAGFPVTVADTAGLRESDDEIEREGVRRSQVRAAEADIVLAVFDLTAAPVFDPASASICEGGSCVVVLNKADALAGSLPEVPGKLAAHPVFVTEAVTGEGLGPLVDYLGEAIAARWGRDEPPMITRERQWESVRAAMDALESALEARDAELRAEDLRMALRHLSRIVGTVGMDEILDRIFRDFCIGK